MTGPAPRTGSSLALFLSLVLAAPVAAADGESAEASSTFAGRRLTSAWSVQTGGTLNAYQTSAAWSPQGLAGAAIFLEDTLGLQEENTAVFVRVSRRLKGPHSLELMAIDLRRSATRIIDDQIEWGDYIFRAQGRVSAELITRLLKLTWRYDFSPGARLNAGLSAGLSTYDLGLTLVGEARLETDQGDEWVDGVVEGADGIAPVPVVGFFLEYALSPSWVLICRSEAMSLDIGHHSGRVVETHLGIEYGVSKLVGVGLGVGTIDMEYRSVEGGEKFGVDYRIESVAAHIVFSF